MDEPQMILVIDPDASNASGILIAWVLGSLIGCALLCVLMKKRFGHWPWTRPTNTR